MDIKKIFFLIPVVFASYESAAARNEMAEFEVRVIANIVAESCLVNGGGDLNYHIKDKTSTKQINEATNWGVKLTINEKVYYECAVGKAKVSFTPLSERCLTSKGMYSCGGINKSVGMLPFVSSDVDPNVRGDLFADEQLVLDALIDKDGKGAFSIPYVHISRLLDKAIIPSPGELYAEYEMTVWNY